MSLLEVRDLVVKFGDKIVVDHVSFDLQAGERLGIIGGAQRGDQHPVGAPCGGSPARVGRRRVDGCADKVDQRRQ